MSTKIPRHIAFFPLSIVKKITNLSSRQIRYYEEQGLIKPARNNGNQRIFSLNDIESFLMIKSLLEQGFYTAGIKEILALKEKEKNIPPKQETQYILTDKELEDFLLHVQEKVNSITNKQ